MYDVNYEELQCQIQDLLKANETFKTEMEELKKSTKELYIKVQQSNNKVQKLIEHNDDILTTVQTFINISNQDLTFVKGKMEEYGKKLQQVCNA